MKAPLASVVQSSPPLSTAALCPLVADEMEEASCPNHMWLQFPDLYSNNEKIGKQVDSTAS